MAIPTNGVEERAAIWLQERRYWSDWSEKDESELDAWLAEDPNHAVAFWRLAGGLERMERLQALRPQQTWAAENRLNVLRHGTSKFIAALVLIVAVSGGTATFYGTRADHVPLTYSTALGGHQIISLTDGSQIELNTNTMVEADITPRYRRITLAYGEAFFQVVHDTKRPFTVDTGGQHIIDLGTQFLARREAGRLEVDLVEGRARVDIDGKRAQSATLTPGDRAIVTAEKLSVTKHMLAEVQEQLSWRHGMIVFDNVRLAAAAADLNRYNQQKVTIVGSGVDNLTFSGTVPVNNVGLFVRSAQTLFNLRIQNHGNEIVISR